MSEKTLMFLKSKPCLPVQGADISMLERLKLLRRFGWVPRVHSLAPAKDMGGLVKLLQNLGIPAAADAAAIRYESRSVPCSISALPDACDVEALRDAFAGEIADAAALLVNARDAAALSFAVNDAGHIRSAVFVTEDEYPRPGAPGGAEFGMLLRKAQGVFVASDYMQGSLLSSWGISAQKIANAVDVDQYRVERQEPGSFITLMQPYANKGVDLFLQLAQQLRERTFLLVAGAGPEYRARKAEFMSVPNLLIHPFRCDPREIYLKSRIVLVPSIWQDASPRVVIEALAAGTPVIGSTRGGVPEAGGGASICLDVVSSDRPPGGRFRTEAWIEAIRALDDPVAYSRRVDAARERIARYRNELERGMTALSSFLEAADTASNR